MGDYGMDYPADYAEVSSFRKAPSEYSGARSPAPYATTSIIGSTRMMHPGGHYPSDLYPLANRSTYCRNVYSESYYNPKEKIHITENQLASHDHLLGAPQPKLTPNSSSTSRKNRLKLKPLQNVHITLPTDAYGPSNHSSQSGGSTQQALSSTSSTSSTTTASMPPAPASLNKSTYHHQFPQQQQPCDEQFYIKVGDTNTGTMAQWNIGGHSQPNHNVNDGDDDDDVGYENNVYVHNNNSSGSQDTRDKNVIYAPSGNRSLISYRSQKDYPDNV
jgi:roundabout, axon guidance receptor 2